jgi:hypothetical protein
LFTRQEIAVIHVDLQELTLRPQLIINPQGLDRVSRGAVSQEGAA